MVTKKHSVLRGIRGEEGGPGSPAYVARFSDLYAASRLIGDTRATRLSWLLRFIDEQPSQWHSATAAAHGDCLLALGGHVIPPNMVGGVPLPPSLESGVVTALHRDVKALLEALVAAKPGEVIEIPSAGLEVGLMKMSAVGAKPAAWGRVTRSASPAVAVMQAVAELVFQSGDRLVACEHCNAPMIAVKKQRFCTPQCAQKFRNEKKARLRESKERRAHGKATRTR